MKQHTLKPSKGALKHKKRIGRGRHRGNYSGRGGKGQTARTGGTITRGFEGGQTPLSRRMPKLKGFKNINKEVFHPINLEQLEIFEEGAIVDGKTLKEKGIIKRDYLRLKLLATGTISKKLIITVHKASETAIKKVEKTGGEVKIVSKDVQKPEANAKMKKSK